MHTESPIQAAIQTSKILLQVANNKPQLAQCYHFLMPTRVLLLLLQTDKEGKRTGKWLNETAQ